MAETGAVDEDGVDFSKLLPGETSLRCRFVWKLLAETAPSSARTMQQKIEFLQSDIRQALNRIAAAKARRMQGRPVSGTDSKRVHADDNVADNGGRHSPATARLDPKR